MGLGQTPGGSLRELERELERARALERATQARIQNLNQELGRLSERVRGLLREKAALEGEILRLEAEREDLKGEMARLREEIQAKEGRIRELEGDLEALKERFKALMRSLHRERAARYLPLLRAQSFGDLAVRARLIGYISRQDTELVRRILALLRALKEERAKLALLVQDLEAKERALSRNQKALEGERARLEEVLASLRREEEGKRALLRETLRERQGLQARVASLQARILAERRRLEEEKRRLEAEKRRQRTVLVMPPPSLPKAVGPLVFPVPGGRILVPYGEEGPFLVIKAPTPGSPVLAAAPGYVVGTLYLPNLGYTVMLAHTEALATVYTNLQTPLVREGQSVARGQVIGYTGGGLLIPPDELEFRVAVRQGTTTLFVDPSRYF